MDGIDQAVTKQIEAQKGGDEVLPLWKDLWRAYQQDGAEGVDDVLNQLLKASVGQE
jgi:hypothetical protein